MVDGRSDHNFGLFFVELVEKIWAMEKEFDYHLLSELEHLESYMIRFFQLEEIKKFRESDEHIERPFNNNVAIWQ